MCEHKEVLFVPIETITNLGGNVLSFTSKPEFICVKCKEYVTRPDDGVFWTPDAFREYKKHCYA